MACGVAACGENGGPAEPLSGGRVAISRVSLAPGAENENVLSARIVFQTQDADSARVLYAAEGGAEQATPTRAAGATQNTAFLFGLRPSTTYSYRVQAVSGRDTATSAEASFTTAPLPEELEGVKLERISGSTPRFTLTTARGRYAVAFDSTGALAWYHDFGGIPVSNAMRQPNGNFTVFVGTTAGWQATDGYYLEITPAGDVAHAWRAPVGEYMDDHEILVLGSGSAAQAMFFTYTIRPYDLSALGGKAAVALAGHDVVRVDANGKVLFRWSAWENIAVDEWVGDDSARAVRSEADFDHPNSLSLDAAGNYVVSWRNLDQVMAIDPRSGNVLWRVGGTRGGYAFVNDPEGGFSKQHAAKVLPNGDLLVYDNGSGHAVAETRAAEYRLDPQARTATLVWQYRHDPALYTQYVGWTERLPDGRTWVAFALQGRVVEVDASGQPAWEAQLTVDGSNASVYRVVPIASLY
jgi:hypothetical protein